MINDINTKGYIKFTEKQGLDLIDINTVNIVHKEERLRDNGIKDIDKKVSERFNLFANFLDYKYIKPKWKKSEFQYWLVWEGVDKDNQGWHTDFMEGYDLFFLYYFDSMNSGTGGSINFKWGENTSQYYPTAGDLFLISNKRGFWHKAENSLIKRRVASFNFKTNE